MFKLCAHCHVIKTTDQFHRDRYTSDGLTSYCASCRNALQREAYEQAGDERRAKGRAGYAVHRERKLERQRERYAAKKSSTAGGTP